MKFEILKSISINFKNFDIIKLSPSEIKAFSYKVIDTYEASNNSTIINVSDLNLKLDSSANHSFPSFSLHQDEPIFYRISRYYDISSIEVVYMNGDTAIIIPNFIPPKHLIDDIDPPNTAQSVSINDGCLTIKVD